MSDNELDVMDTSLTVASRITALIVVIVVTYLTFMEKLNGNSLPLYLSLLLIGYGIVLGITYLCVRHRVKIKYWISLNILNW